MIKTIKAKKNIILAVIVIVCVLAAVFFLQNGWDRPGNDPETIIESESAVSTNADSGQETVNVDANSGSGTVNDTQAGVQSASSVEPKQKKVSENTAAPNIKQAANSASEPKTQGMIESDPETPTCSLMINCSAILSNMDKLAKEKEDLAPADGRLLNLSDVKFEKGDTVFDVLKRELKSRNMHLEFSTTPAYHSVYIEGICNLYEFDCGEQSGWKYAVNGVFPSCSCSEYVLSDGDVISWEYTCVQ
jgi:hypothetical protein